jgi:hypothetical protein
MEGSVTSKLQFRSRGPSDCQVTGISPWTWKTSLRGTTEVERLFDVAWGCSLTTKLTTNGTDGPARKRTTTNSYARTYGLCEHP